MCKDVLLLGAGFWLLTPNFQILGFICIHLYYNNESSILFGKEFYTAKVANPLSGSWYCSIWHFLETFLAGANTIILRLTFSLSVLAGSLFIFCRSAAKRFERCSHLFSEEFRLFPGGEVTTLGDFMEVVQRRIGLP